MKNIFISLMSAIFAFVAGIACALFAADSLVEKAWADMRSSMHFWQYDNQDSAAIILSTIRAAEKGDVKTTIRLNCMVLRMKVRNISPETFSTAPARQKEVRAFVEEARDTVFRLDAQGLCSFPAHSPDEGDADAK